MKKPGKQTRNNLFNALLIIGTIGIVIYLGAKNGDLGAALNAVVRADYRWLIGAFGCWLMFVLTEALSMSAFYRMQKVKVSFGNTLVVSMIGMFYSNVTPAATGGQPMQVYSMKKRGVPSGVTTSGLTVKFFTYQIALLLIGAGLWILFPEKVQENLGASRYFIYIGFAINGFAVALVLLLAINKNLVRAMITLIINLGQKLHLIKDIAATTSRTDAALEDFQTSVYMLTHHPFQLFVLFLISCMDVIAQMSVTYCVYRALGLNQVAYADILTLSFLLFIGASFMPLPGASGAQEGGFYLIFKNIFPDDTILAGLLLWRFITYYWSLLVSLLFVIFDSVRNMGKEKNKNHTTDPETEDEITMEGDGEKL